MDVTEETCLKNLKILIEKKLGWKNSNEWTHGDFEELSVQIQEKTKVSISANTLKRVWGKMKSSSKPTFTTKNALASFAGFNSWHHYVQEVSNGRKEKGKFYLSPFQWGIVTVIIAGFVLLFFFNRQALINGGRILGLSRQPYDTTKIAFNVKKYMDHVPFSVQFNYDATSIDQDTLYIKHKWNPKDILKNDSGTHTILHFIPNYYCPGLYADGQLVGRDCYHALSNGWQFIYPYSSWEPRFYLRLDTLNLSYLQMPPRLLKKNNLDISLENHLVTYHFSKPFNASADDFTLKTRIRNHIEEGGFTCQECILYLQSAKSVVKINFTDRSCIKNAHITVSEVEKSGVDYDLSALGLNMNKWNDLTIKVKKNRLLIFLKEDLLHSEKYENSLGLLKSIKYTFRGCGKVDYVKVFDGEDKVVYKEDF